MAVIKAIACEVMRDEWAAVNDKDIETCFLEQGLHRRPEDLHRKLQDAIDQCSTCDIILLGYGLCSNALVGLQAKQQSIVIPLVEDCIGLFLGSAAAYTAEFKKEPGTYYFTKGWVVARKDPYQEYLQYCEQWGEEDAEWVTREMMKNYQRAAYIDTGCYESAEYFDYAKKFAGFFKLRTEIISGSLNFFRELVSADWRHCLILAPDEQLTEARFREGMNRKCEKK